MTLRNYQQNIVDEVLEKDDNVLVVLPTGGGKTVIANEIIKNVKEKVLFIVPKLELIKQAAHTFNEDVDIIWSSQTHVYGNHITVASKQTLLHRDLSKYFHEPIVVIVDEVHIGLQSLKKVLTGVPVKRIIGLTATPERNDGSSFIEKEYCKQKFDKDKIYQYAVFQRVINKWNIQELQRLEYLSPLNVVINPDAEKLKNIKPKHKYDDELDSDVIMGEMGDDFFKFVKMAMKFVGKPTLVFTPDLQSLDVVMNTLNKSGLKYEHVDGAMPVEERQEVLKKLEEGKIDGVVNCGVLTTGFDMPKVKQCILIRNIKSRSLFFQIVGRFIRPYKGETAQIYDFGGSSYNFATASNPDIFKSPVDWQYEGFESKEEDEDEAEKTEELKDCLSEANITWTEYLKDPMGTLLNSLLMYKENFEQNLCNEQERLKKNFNASVDKAVEKQKKQIRKEIIKDSENIIKEEAKKQAMDLGLNPMKNWFAVNGFEWFRTNFPHILADNDYDDASEFLAMKMEFYACKEEEDFKLFESRHKFVLEKLEKIKLNVITMLPFDGLLKQLNDSKEAYDEFTMLYDQRTDWWLSHYKKRA